MVGLTTKGKLYYKVTALGRLRITAIRKLLVMSKSWLHSHLPVSVSCFGIIKQIVLLAMLMFKQFVRALMKSDQHCLEDGSNLVKFTVKSDILDLLIRSQAKSFGDFIHKQNGAANRSNQVFHGITRVGQRATANIYIYIYIFFFFPVQWL